MDPQVKPKAMVAVEFGPGVGAEQVEAFARNLSSGCWERVPEMARVWRAVFSQGSPLDVPVSMAKEDVGRAAQKAGILHHQFKAAVMVGPLLPTKF